MSERDRTKDLETDPTTKATPPAQLPLGILLIDDERNIRKTMRTCLEADGHRVWEAEAEQAALVALGRESIDMAFLDLRLGQASGLDLLPELLAERNGLTVVIITAYASVDTAIEAIRRGARDYLPKPFTPAQLRLVVSRLQERLTAERHLIELQAQLDEIAPPVELDTHSHRMRAVLDLIHRAADSDATVAPPSPASYLPASCLGTRGAPSLERCVTKLAESKPLPAAPSSSMRSASCRRRSRPRSFDSCKTGSTSEWARRVRAAPTSGSWRQPTATSRPTSRRAASARISGSGSTSSRSRFPRCASGPRMSSRSPTIC
jgi:ActR/RegA family two-component response regulator